MVLTMTLAPKFENYVKRPDRKMPTLFACAEYWAERLQPEADRWPRVRFDVALAEPFCFRCGWLAPVEEEGPTKTRWAKATPYLDRAHLIDRFQGGLDVVANIIPLCHLCHRVMGMFEPGKETEVFAWLRLGPTRDPLLQLMTDQWRVDCIDTYVSYMEIQGMAETQRRSYLHSENHVPFKKTISQGTKAGLEKARARGRLGGRKREVTDEQILQMKTLYHKREMSVTEIAKTLGVSRQTIYRYVKDSCNS